MTKEGGREEQKELRKERRNIKMGKEEKKLSMEKDYLYEKGEGIKKLRKKEMGRGSEGGKQLEMRYGEGG